jgi:predicted transcriptional regulator
MPGKRVQLDDETWRALDLLAKDRMQDFQELADEAFAAAEARPACRPQVRLAAECR